MYVQQTGEMQFISAGSHAFFVILWISCGRSGVAVVSAAVGTREQVRFFPGRPRAQMTRAACR
jgi:hypothetical protein